MRVTVLAAMLCCAACGPEQQQPEKVELRTGPFGIDLGQPLSELDLKPIPQRPGWYTVNQFSRLHPLFQELSVWGSPTVGVCTIEAQGPRHIGDHHGDKVRADIEMVSRELALKYGPKKEFDTCESGLTECSYDSYIDNLRSNVVDSFNYDRSEGAKLPKGMAAIRLYPDADDERQTYAVLRYIALNRQDCEAEIAKLGAASL